MKVVIVVPPISDFYFTPRRWSSLGAEAVKRELQRLEVEAEVIDFPAIGPRETRKLPTELNHLTPYLMPAERGPLTYHRRYSRYGPDVDSCVLAIERAEPDLCFLSLFAYCYTEDALAVARVLKSVMPEVPLVAGGHAVSVLPFRFLREVDEAESDKFVFDLIVSGEVDGNGERIMAALHDQAYRHLDLRGEVDESLTPVISHPAVAVKDHNWFSVALTRGCPVGCEFCSNHLCHGAQFRVPKQEAIIAETEQILANRISPLHINIEDDNILLAPQLLSQFMTAVLQLYPQTTFSAENGLDFRQLSQTDVIELKTLGFTHLNLSFGSREQARSRQQLSEVVYAAEEAGLPATVHFICGMKDDTPESVVETLVYLDGLPAQIGISLFYPVPGLPGFDDLDAMIDEPAIRMMGSAAWPWTGSLTTSQMVTAFRLSRWSNAKKAAIDTSSDVLIRDLLNQCAQQRSLSTIVRNSGENIIARVDHLDADMMDHFFIGIC